MKKEYGKGFSLSDLLQQQGAREALLKQLVAPNPFLPTATAEGVPKKEGVLRASVTAQFSGGGSGGASGSTLGNPFADAGIRFQPPQIPASGYTFVGVLGGPIPSGADYDEMVRADGTVVRRDPVTMQTWLPEFEPKPEPEGRFQNLDWDE